MTERKSVTVSELAALVIALRTASMRAQQIGHDRVVTHVNQCDDCIHGNRCDDELRLRIAVAVDGGRDTGIRALYAAVVRDTTDLDSGELAALIFVKKTSRGWRFDG